MEYTHEKYIEMIDEALKVYLGSVSDGQDVVLDAMKYSAEGGGKRIRRLFPCVDLVVRFRQLWQQEP